MSVQRPQFAILGAGAIGSIIGAHLARAGHSVVMLARGRRAEFLQREGLRIRGLADIDVRTPTIADPAQFAGAEVFIVATKTNGTAEALEAVKHAQVDVAFSIQNGLWKNDALADAFGREKVLGSLANTSGELLASGEVLFTRNVNVFIGELDGGDSERAQRIAGTIDAAGVRSTAVPNILAREWTKFVGWVGLMSMSVATRALTGKYLSDPDCALLLVRLVREMTALAQASGIVLTEQDQLLPINAILRSDDAAAVEAVMRAGREFQRNAPEHRMSALGDARGCGAAGRPARAFLAAARNDVSPGRGDRSDEPGLGLLDASCSLPGSSGLEPRAPEVLASCKRRRSTTGGAKGTPAQGDLCDSDVVCSPRSLSSRSAQRARARKSPGTCASRKTAARPMASSKAKRCASSLRRPGCRASRPAGRKSSAR